MRGAGRGDRRLPWVTAAAAVAALIVHAAPGWSEWLQLSWPGVAAGEWWRLATGQLTHWSWRHLWWDVATFAVVGGLCEIEDRRRFLLCLIASLTIAPLLLYCVLDGFMHFRGLSGVDCALFALAGARMTRDTRRGARWLGGAALSLLLGKVLFEVLSGQALFVRGTAVATVPAAHAVGAALGILCALVPVSPWVPSRRSIRAMDTDIEMSLHLSENTVRR